MATAVADVTERFQSFTWAMEKWPAKDALLFLFLPSLLAAAVNIVAVDVAVVVAVVVVVLFLLFSLLLQVRVARISHK